MNPKKADFANWRLLPPAFSLRTLGAYGLKGARGNPGDDGSTAIDEEAGQDASVCIAYLSEHLSGTGSAGLSGDTLIPAGGRDISHLTSSQGS